MKNLKSTILLSAALLIGAGQAQADLALNWLDTDTASTFIELDKLNAVITQQVYQSTVDTSTAGGALTLDNGDVVTENISLITTSSALAGSLNFDLSADYRIDLSLTGVIANIQGTGITITDDNSVTPGGFDSVTGLATTSFEVNFTGATITLVDAKGAVTIASLSFISGGTSAVELVAGSLIGDITVNAFLDTNSEPFLTQGDSYILDENMLSIINKEIVTITTGSSRIATNAQSKDAGFQDIPVYGDADATTLFVTFADNGEATIFRAVPEPSIVGLLGFGILGLGLARRMKTRKTMAA